MTTEWIAHDNAPWVHGIKKKTTGPYVFAHIASVVGKRFSDIPRAPSSAATETDLAYPPSIYWYLGRADDLYGSVVFLCEARTETAGESDGGVCPFDSGGMWTGRIALNPPAPAKSTERREILSRYTMSLSGWKALFGQHLTRAYASPLGYVRGHPPTNPPSGFPVICANPPNHPVAWTWEGRVVYEHADKRVHARHAYMAADRRHALRSWLLTQPWHVLREVRSWLKDHVDTVPLGRSPARAANDLLERVLS